MVRAPRPSSHARYLRIAASSGVNSPVINLSSVDLRSSNLSGADFANCYIFRDGKKILVKLVEVEVES